MKFRSEVQVVSPGFTLAHEDGMILVGSCFSEEIGERLKKLKFRVEINPFGIIYNPVAIADNISYAMGWADRPAASLVQHNERFHSLLHHGSISCATLETIQERINEADSVFAAHISKSKFLFLTLGTGWVYRHRDTGLLVANCHKLPQQAFIKELLSVEAVYGSMRLVLRKLCEMYPSLKVVLTISPVKHLRNGIVENNQGKAVLVLAAAQLAAEGLVTYFPAYELVTDDLRDYRFYEADLAHPTAQAVEYVWEKFSGAYFDEATRQLNARISRILVSDAHRPLEAGSAAHHRFLENLEKEKQQLFIDAGIKL